MENEVYPDPPEKHRPSTATLDGSFPRDNKLNWYGPQNWFTDFPDLFRARLITTYFDGVRYLAEKVHGLADTMSTKPPQLDMKATHDGYHAAHVGVYQEVPLQDYDNKDRVVVEVQLEIQVMTSIHATINDMLHQIYEDWRLNGAAENWEWNHNSSAFSVNYLGNTLHYLEGMILTARDRSGGHL